MSKRYLLSLLLALGVWFFLTGSPEARQYHYWDLGTFTGLQPQPGQGQPVGEALGLNDQGQIVGWAWIWNAGDNAWEQHAVRWDLATRTSQDLGAGNNSFAYSINNLGQIVGMDATGAFFWDPGNQTPQPLENTLGGTQARANKINDQGQVVGYASDGAENPLAVSWDPVTHAVHVLGTMGGTQSWANDINSQGQIVGTSLTDTDGDFGAYFRDPTSGVLQPLGSLGGGWSAGLGLNGLGQVVGWSLIGSGSTHAFWLPGLQAQMQDLGILPGNFDYSMALSLNDQGQIVGECGLSTNPISAFLWTAAKGMQDLNASGLVVNRPAGVSLMRARAINRCGQLVGITSDYRPFLLTPIAPLPYLQLLLLD